MKYIFDSTTFKLISTVGSELWVVGDNNTKTLEFHFTDTENIDNFECRAVIKRADGETTNEIICTPVHSGSENYYKLVIGNWITEISGSVDITVRRKKYNTVTGEYDIYSYGVIKKDVSEGVNPDIEQTITDEQYLALLTSIADMQPNLIPKITDLDSTILDGVYKFEHGYLVVNNNKQLKITAGPLERRELVDDVWSAWSDKIVINSSIIADYLKINNIDVEQNAIIYGNLIVHDGINANDDFIKNVATPVVKGDAANKGYVDLVQDDLNITKNNLSYLQEALLLTGEETVKFAEHANDADNSVKAVRDQNGNVINTHYGTKQELTNHDNNTVAHLFIRQLIEILDGRMDRFEGRGKSQGVLNYLQSELVLMSETDRNTAINIDIASDFIPTSGDLVYTKDSTMENTHEWEYNGTTWVDNGAYTVQKASNDIFGLVKGNNGYVNIVNGLIEVIKSDNTDKIGEYTYNDIKTFLERLDSELDNVYTKEQTYTKSQIDLIINNLKTIYGWEESTIKSKWGIENATIGKLLKSEFENYDYLVINKLNSLDDGIIKSDFVKVSEILSLYDASNVLIAYDENAFDFVQYNGVDELQFHNSTGDLVVYSVYGLKTTPLTADKVSYSTGNVKETLDNAASVGQKNIRHKALMVEPNGLFLNGYDMIFPFDAFKNGFFVEVCSYEAFVNNEDWKYDYDILVINTQNEIMPDATITAAQVVETINKYMSVGVKLLLFLGDAFINIKKFNIDGTAVNASLQPLISNMSTAPAKNFSAQTGVFAHGDNYPFSEEVINNICVPSSGSLLDLSSPDPTVIYPVIATDTNLGITSRVVAYKPNTFAIILHGGGAGASIDKVPSWKYVKTDVIINTLLGKENKPRICMDKKFGRRIASFGIDSDSSNDLEATENLRNSIPMDIPVEWGLVSSKITPDVAGYYHNLKGENRFCTHTKTHYNNALTKDNEIHTIPSSQIIRLMQPCGAIITSVKTVDDTITFTKVAGGNILRTAPVASKYIINEIAGIANQTWDGKLKFHSSDIGKQIKVSYSYFDEVDELFGSIKQLEDLGILTEKSVYGTRGPQVIYPVSFLRALKDEVVFPDYANFPSYARVWRGLAPTQTRMSLTMGVTALFEWRYAIIDTNLFNHPKAQAKEYIDNAISWCNSNNLPYVWYLHDFLLSRTSATGVWVDGSNRWNADYKKATFEESLTYMQDLYVYMFNQIKAQNPYWLIRTDYVRFYNYINQYITYDVQGSKVKISNTGEKPIKGLTVEVPLSTIPTIVKMNNGLKVNYTYVNNIVTVWFDILAGETLVLDVQ